MEAVQQAFLPLVLALSAVQAAALAEQLHAGTIAFSAVYGPALIILLTGAAVVLGPMCAFVTRLWACRMKGIEEYMQLASHHVEGFDAKWLRGRRPKEEPLLGTPDMQSLADLAHPPA